MDVAEKFHFFQRIDGEKVLAGVRSVGVGLMLAGAVGVFFTGGVIQSAIAMAFGFGILMAGSYTNNRGGKDG